MNTLKKEKTKKNNVDIFIRNLQQHNKPNFPIQSINQQQQQQQYHGNINQKQQQPQQIIKGKINKSNLNYPSMSHINTHQQHQLHPHHHHQNLQQQKQQQQLNKNNLQYPSMSVINSDQQQQQLHLIQQKYKKNKNPEEIKKCQSSSNIFFQNSQQFTTLPLPPKQSTINQRKPYLVEQQSFPQQHRQQINTKNQLKKCQSKIEICTPLGGRFAKNPNKHHSKVNTIRKTSRNLISSDDFYQFQEEPKSNLVKYKFKSESNLKSPKFDENPPKLPPRNNPFKKGTIRSIALKTQPQYGFCIDCSSMDFSKKGSIEVSVKNFPRIALISEGSIAESAGIKEGDYLIEVNNISTELKTDKEIFAIVKHTKVPIIIFKFATMATDLNSEKTIQNQIVETKNNVSIIKITSEDEEEPETKTEKTQDSCNAYEEIDKVQKTIETVTMETHRNRFQKNKKLSFDEINNKKNDKKIPFFDMIGKENNNNNNNNNNINNNNNNNDNNNNNNNNNNDNIINNNEEADDVEIRKKMIPEQIVSKKVNRPFSTSAAYGNKITPFHPQPQQPKPVMVTMATSNKSRNSSGFFSESENISNGSVQSSEFSSGSSTTNEFNDQNNIFNKNVFNNNNNMKSDILNYVNKNKNLLFYKNNNINSKTGEIIFSPTIVKGNRPPNSFPHPLHHQNSTPDPLVNFVNQPINHKQFSTLPSQKRLTSQISHEMIKSQQPQTNTFPLWSLFQTKTSDAPPPLPPKILREKPKTINKKPLPEISTSGLSKRAVFEVAKMEEEQKKDDINFSFGQKNEELSFLNPLFEKSKQKNLILNFPPDPFPLPPLSSAFSPPHPSHDSKPIQLPHLSPRQQTGNQNQLNSSPPSTIKNSSNSSSSSSSSSLIHQAPSFSKISPPTQFSKETKLIINDLTSDPLLPFHSHTPLPKLASQGSDDKTNGSFPIINNPIPPTHITPPIFSATPTHQTPLTPLTPPPSLTPTNPQIFSEKKYDNIIKTWSTDKLCNWLTNNNYNNNIINNFKTNNITGNSLLNLNRNMLISLGFSETKERRDFERLLLKIRQRGFE